jgi:predicted phosphodiesterase
MRLALLSDVHGNLIALETVLADLTAQGGADKLWLLGDYAASGARPRECIQRLQSLMTSMGEGNAAAVRGNTDKYLVTGLRPTSKPADSEEAFSKLATARRKTAANLDWVLEQLTYAEYEWLAKLRGEVDLEVKGYGWVIGYHGTPGDDEGFLFPHTPLEAADDALLDREGRLGIGAHIHEQMDRQLTRWRVLNIGSVGMSFQSPGIAQYALLTFEGAEVNVDLRSIPYDVERAITDLHQSGYPNPQDAARRLREGNA